MRQNRATFRGPGSQAPVEMLLVESNKAPETSSRANLQGKAGQKASQANSPARHNASLVSDRDSPLGDGSLPVSSRRDLGNFGQLNSNSRLSLYNCGSGPEPMIGRSVGASKKDPELIGETRDVKFEYPFAISKNEKYPVASRWLVSIRTQKDFPNPNKFAKDNTPEEILKKIEARNPYKLNRAVRKRTKG